MGTLKAAGHHSQPAGHEPRGDKALRVHLDAGSPEPGLPGLTVPEPKEQGQDHCVYRVLVVGDQLEWKERKGLAGAIAQGPGNGDKFFSKLGEQVNGIPLVRGDLPVAVGLSADGAGRAYVRENIDSPGKECFLVFPNGVVGVMVGELNLSAPCPQGSTFGCYAVMMLPCGAWLN